MEQEGQTTQEEKGINALSKLVKAFADFKKKYWVFGPGYKDKEAVFPLSVKDIDFKARMPFSKKDGPFGKTASGDFVQVRLASNEDENTYLGIFLGMLDYKPAANYNHEQQTLQVVLTGSSPAIYVPKLKRVVFGFESWWKKINKESDLEDITDEMIQSTWYVALAKEMFSGTDNTNSAGSRLPAGDSDNSGCDEDPGASVPEIWQGSPGVGLPDDETDMEGHEEQKAEKPNKEGKAGPS